jgi:hypothetical protein
MTQGNFAPSIANGEGREFGPHDKPATPKQIAPDEKTVTMVFPKKVTLTTDKFKRVHFPAGVNDVPESLASHPYLELNGVKRHGSGVIASALPEVPALTKEEFHQKVKDFFEGPGAAQHLFPDHALEGENLDDMKDRLELEDDDEDDDGDDGDDSEPGAVTAESLGKLTKAELVDLGKKDYNLELDPVAKKDDLITEILEAIQKG